MGVLLLPQVIQTRSGVAPDQVQRLGDLLAAAQLQGGEGLLLGEGGVPGLVGGGVLLPIEGRGVAEAELLHLGGGDGAVLGELGPGGLLEDEDDAEVVDAGAVEAVAVALSAELVLVAVE